MVILRILGCWPRIWGMLRSWLGNLSVVSVCLGSHPPEGGVVLGSDCYFGYFMYFERNLQLCYFVCCIVVILFYVLYIIIGILGLCLYCSMHV